MRDYTEFKYHKHFFESERLLNNLIIQIFPEFSWRYYKCSDVTLLDSGFLEVTNSALTEISEEEYKLEKSSKYQTLNYEIQDEIIQSKNFSSEIGSFMEYLFVEFQHAIHDVYKKTEIQNKDYIFKNLLKAIEESNDYYNSLLANFNINEVQGIIIQSLIEESQRKSELIKNEFSDLVPYVANYSLRKFSIPFLNKVSEKEQFHSLDIFSSEETKKWFMDTLEMMNISPEKNGFNAKLNAIYRNVDCKENIFKYELSLKDYISFINSIFPHSIKNSTKMSDSTRHDPRVSQLIKIYLQDKSE